MNGFDAQTEYVLEYRHGGSAWGLSFFAVDDADAEAKVESLKASLFLKGRLMGRGDSQEDALQAAAKTACDEVIGRLGCSRGSSPRGPAGGVLAHHINDGRDFIKPQLDPLWGEAIFGSKLAEKLGKDDLMLQRLHCAVVLQSDAPSLQGKLKGLVAKVSAFVRTILQPRNSNGWDGADCDPAKGKQPVYKRGVSGHNDACIGRPDEMIVLRRTDPANEFDVVW